MDVRIGKEQLVDTAAADQRRSGRLLIGMLLLYAALSVLPVAFGQRPALWVKIAPATPAIQWLGVLIGGAVLFGNCRWLGELGLGLTRRLGLPELWDSRVTNRQRFVVPAVAGTALGIALVATEVLLSRFTSVGYLSHRSFPLSYIRILAGAVGDEVVMRLFAVSLLTWLLSSVILRGRQQTRIYWVVSAVLAVIIGGSFVAWSILLNGWSGLNQVPLLPTAEVIVLFGIESLIGAYYFRRSGALAAVSLRFWAFLVWQIVWQAISI